MTSAYGYNWRAAESPIKLNSSGHARIWLVGNSGTGKSTTADRLAEILGYPVLHLDEVRWQPNWMLRPAAERKEKVQIFSSTNQNWVIDGNCNAVLRDIVASRATCVVWLDPPFMLYFPRLFIRTLGRLLGFKRPCSPGCTESPSSLFTWGEENILWCSWTRHNPVRLRYTACMQTPGEENGQKWIRLGGWGGELEAWTLKVKSSLKKTKRHEQSKRQKWSMRDPK